MIIVYCICQSFQQVCLLGLEYSFKSNNPTFIDVRIQQTNCKKLMCLLQLKILGRGLSTPYSQIPLKVSENVPKPGMGRQLNFKIEENVWKHLKGEEETEDCLQESNMNMENCTSLFHPYSYQFNTR